jgi:hypothetical protein
VTLIHQDHDYTHAKAVDVWNGAEAVQNRKWIKHWTNYYTIAHATWTLRSDGTVSRASGWRYRMARPRQLLSHALRASRRIRTRLRSRRLARHYGL